MISLKSIYSEMILVLVLSKRDYAMQYAGTFLGIIWLLVQYSFQIAVYYVLFAVLFSDGGGRFVHEGDYFLYIMSGMMLWIPVSEMLVRSSSIICDNKPLVKRTGMGMRLFIRIPAVQGIFYYLLLFSIVFAAGIFRGGAGLSSIVSVFYGVFAILFFGIWTGIFARVSLILKDFAPVMRLVMQLLFWMTPVIYKLPEKYVPIMSWNPFYGLIELNRWLFHSDYPVVTFTDLRGLFFFSIISVIAFFISKIRLESVALDQI